MIEREVVGGQAGMSSLIRNYLGFPRGISGAELAKRAYAQAWLFGAKYALAREVAGLALRGDRRIVKLADGREITCRAVLVATGMSYRRLGVPSLERFNGAGVFYTLPFDTGMSHLMQGHDAFVVGGGNSAGQAVVHLAKSARKVTLLVRGDSLEAHMSDYLVQDIRRAPNVEVRLLTEPVGGEGEVQLERLTVRHRASGATETVPAQALFVLVGRGAAHRVALRRRGAGRPRLRRDRRRPRRHGAPRLAALAPPDALRDERARRVRRR